MHFNRCAGIGRAALVNYGKDHGRLVIERNWLYAPIAIPQGQHARPTRTFAKEAAPPSLKGDDILKSIFFEIKAKFDMTRSILKKEKITIDPEDPAAVAQYAKVLKTIREKADIPSESQRILETIQQKTQGIPDARAYLLALKEIRVKKGLDDDLGLETMMMDALEKVEKEIKKPLLRDDKKGMSLLMTEFEKINKKLGIRKEDLPKYEEQLELKMAKEHLQDLKNETEEAMKAALKRPEFKDEQMVDAKSLDIRNVM